MASWDTLRQLALELPGAEESTSYRTPAFKVKGKLFARLKEDGESVVVKVDFDERDTLLAADPKAFFITDHYLNHPMVQVRLSAIRKAQLRDLLESSWRRAAPKRLIAEYDARTGSPGPG